MPEINDELLLNIKREKNQGDSHDRYPIRFLFFPLSKDLSPYLFSLIDSLSLRVKKLSDYFQEDKWETWEKIYSKIEEEIEKSSSDLLFIGLSEFLRFQEKQSVKSIFINLIGMENTLNNRRAKRRAYFLMDSFENLFTKLVIENHHRNIFYDPIIRGENYSVSPEAKKPELIISSIASSGDNLLKTVREYLDISTRTDYLDFSKSVYCSSKTIVSLSSKYTDFLEDSLFNYSLIDDPLTILSKKVVGLKLSNTSDEDFIKWLSEGINMDSEPLNFNDFVAKKLNIETTSIQQLFLRLFNTDKANEKKLILLTFEIIGQNQSTYSYISYLLKTYKINTKQEFLKQVYLCTDLFILNAMFKERKEILSILRNENGELEAPEGLIEIFSSELTRIAKQNIYLEPEFKLSIKDDFRQSLLEKTSTQEQVGVIFNAFKKEFVDKILTLNSQLEKRICILLASNSVFTHQELEQIYPELFGYLFYSPIAMKNNSLLDNYFMQYKMSKILNRANNKLAQLVNGYTPDYFLSLYNNSDYKNIDSTLKAKHVFVFDGVGAEYLSLLSYLFEKENNIKLTSVEYRKALLPTITEINKNLILDLYKEPTWLYNFDSEIIHGESYSVERNVEKSISLLQTMVKQVVQMANGESFILIADHGCTASHKLFKASKKYDSFSTAEHDGRCYKITGNEPSIKESNDYIKYVDREGHDWIIAVNYTSLNNTGRYEVHGGATIEEIFVPAIYYAGSEVTQDYTISVVKKTVSGLDKSIKFTVNPGVDPNDITIIEETGIIDKPFLSEGLYICNLSTGRAQKIKIRINSFEEEVSVTNTSGINSGSGGFF